MNFDSAYQSFNAWTQKSMAWFSNSTSAMDLHTTVICAGVFVISALVVYLISVFTMRERTYEEAIEEQRRRNQEAIQQAKTDKGKKDKKFKKWGKKSKEKAEEDKTTTNCEAEKVSEESENKPEPESNSNCNLGESKASALKKKGRQRKLVVQEKGEGFTQQQSSSEETDEPASVGSSTGNNVVTNEEDRKNVQMDKIIRSKEEFKTQNSESSLDLPDEKAEEIDCVKIVKKSPVKKNRKNKVDNSELGYNSEIVEWNETKLLNIIKVTAFTEDEVQHLTDALNIKVKGCVDKKKNEIALLKKLLQEKEEAIRSEQKLCQTATEQINELIQELNEKKSQACVAEKSLRDALNQEQQEIKALHGMMQRKREQYASELAGMQSKMQQMKNKMKEEHTLALQRLQEENNQLQSLSRMESEKQQRSTLEISRLQHEVEQLRTSREKFETHQAAMQQSQEDLHHQIQQLEKHIEQLVSSHQEEEYSYKQRINEMSNKIQQTENARSSLVQELQNAQSVCSSLEGDNSSLRQRLEEAKHQLNSSEQDLMKLQNRIEEANRQQRDLTNCLEKMRDEVVDLSNIKHEHLQVIQTLKQENESLASQISQSMERMAADGTDQQQENGETEKTKLIDAEEHKAIVQEKEAVVHRLLQELEQCKSDIMSLSSDLESQKQANKKLNDEKNKAVEALTAVEKKLYEVVESAEKRVQEAQVKADNCSKDMQNILNEQIKEVELSLQENYAKQLQSVRQDAENIKKEADERILKAETQANLRLEEFQESLYARLNQINFESEEKIKEAVQEKELMKSDLDNFAVCMKEFLCRIFPNISVPQTFDNKLLFLNDYEKEVRSHLEKLKINMKHDSKDIDNMIKKLEENATEKLNLEAQIKNYENVLAETESILKTLQNNIEHEEKKWEKELQSRDGCLKEIQDENEKLKAQNKTLQANMEQLQGLREALYEIEELRLKLQKEELEKKLLQEKLGVLDSLTNSSNIPVTDHTLTQIPEVNSNILPTKSEKRKKSRKRGASGKK